MREVLFLIAALILAGCITSVEPYYDDENTSLVDIIPEKAVVFVKNQYIRVWKKPGHSKIYEADDWDNIAIVKKENKSKKIQGDFGNNVFLLQATHKSDGLTYYFNIKPYMEQEIADLDIGAERLPQGVLAVSPQSINIKSIEERLKRYNDPMYGNKKEVLFESRQHNGKDIKDYNIFYLDRVMPVVLRDDTATYTDIPAPYNINREEYRKKRSPIVIFDEDNPVHASIIAIFDNKIGKYVNSNPEDELEKAEWEHWVKKQCNNIFYRADENGRPIVTNLLQTLSGLRIFPEGKHCVLKSYMEDLALFVLDVTDINCEKLGDQLRCTYTSEIGCQRLASRGTNLASSCSLLPTWKNRGVALLETTADGSYRVATMAYDWEEAAKATQSLDQSAGRDPIAGAKNWFAPRKDKTPNSLNPNSQTPSASDIREWVADYAGGLGMKVKSFDFDKCVALEDGGSLCRFRARYEGTDPLSNALARAGDLQGFFWAKFKKTGSRWHNVKSYIDCTFTETQSDCTAIK